MTTFKPTFEVDKAGLEKILARRGKQFAILELIQNAFDEQTTVVRVGLTPVPGSRRYEIYVEDDNPEGFKDLSHAYTLFAESDKKSNPEQRGRFNIGEKLVIAACTEATIATTKGTVVFGDKGRRELRARRERGSLFTGEIKMTREEARKVERAVRSIIVPPEITVGFNGTPIARREPVATGSVTLATEISDEEGYLRPTRRNTVVEIYETLTDETPTLYEMGLPVVETGDRWHMNILQKVPVSMDRESVVTPAYLRDVRTFVLNTMADKLEGEDATGNWVNEALADENVESEAVEKVLTERYGEKRVIFDPSDPEANKLAMSKGYTVIPGRSFSANAWKNVRRFETALPAGRVTPSPRPYSDDPSAPVRQELSAEQWTDGMHRIVEFSKWLAIELLAARIQVCIINDPSCMNFGATYGKFGEGSGVLEFNYRTLGRAWFENEPFSERVLRLLLHEFAHHFSGDHLSSEYHEAICKLGAKLPYIALKNPKRFGDR